MALVVPLALVACNSPTGKPTSPPLRPIADLETTASTRSVPDVDPNAAGWATPTSDPNETPGAGTLLIYTSVAGHVPYRSVTREGVVYRDTSSQDQEAARTASIQEEITASLERQNALEFESTEGAGLTAPDLAALEPVSRIAPLAPEADLRPAISLAAGAETIEDGRWGNHRSIAVVRHEVDINGDGKSDETRYFEQRSGMLLRTARDLDSDGKLDSWDTYDQAGILSRSRDRDGDGRIDLWEEFSRGRLSTRRVDQDGDGNADAVYRYEGVSLVEERHDSDRDGAIDLVVSYHNRVLVSAEEDRNRDGQTDTWTSYRLQGGTEVATRVDRDRNNDGSPDVRKTLATPRTGEPSEDLSPL
ncbi:hypothetical protein MK489_08235 [Myxococcota bacterium]|nr:hypothetical protein [Myxococcota bacterium]